MGVDFPDPWAALWSDTGDRPSPDAAAAWRRATQADPALRRLRTVVDLLFGDGFRIRVSTQPVDAQRGTADRWVIAGLPGPLPVVDSYELDGAGGSERSIDVSVPGEAVEARERLAALRPFGGVAEISVIVPGMRWTDRRVILVGIWGGIAVRGLGLQVDGSVADPRALVDVEIGSVVDAVAWEDPYEASVGVVYPVAWGGGVVQCLRVDASGATPRWAIVEGHGWTIDALWVRVGDEDQSVPAADYSITEVVDGRGVAVTLVETDPGVATYEDGTRMFAEVRRELDPDTSVLDVFEAAVQRWGPSDMLSRPLLAEARRAALTLPTRVVLSDQSTLLRWLPEGLISDYPMISLVWAGGAFGPVVTDYRTEPVADLHLGADLWDRASDPAETPATEVYTSFRVRYGWDARREAFTGDVRANARNNAVCAAAEQVTRGRREYPTIEGVTLPDAYAAGVVLDWLVAHLTAQTWEIAYNGPAALYFRLALGQTVTLTDGELGWARVRATVEAITLELGRSVLTLRVWGGPLRRVPRAR